MTRIIPKSTNPHRPEACLNMSSGKFEHLLMCTSYDIPCALIYVHSSTKTYIRGITSEVKIFLSLKTTDRRDMNFLITFYLF